MCERTVEVKVRNGMLIMSEKVFRAPIEENVICIIVRVASIIMIDRPRAFIITDKHVSRDVRESGADARRHTVALFDIRCAIP